MSWGLFVLLLIIFICVSVLLFLTLKDFEYFYEAYFIIVVIALFIILIFAIDFNNPITTTVYIQNKTQPSTIIYSVPYNDDGNYANIMTMTYNGVWSPTMDPVNQDSYKDTVTFNYDTFTDATIVSMSGKIKATKLSNYRIQVDVDPTVGGASTLNGFLTLNLLCTGSQSINGKFEQL
jgi:hypothetical protein